MKQKSILFSVFAMMMVVMFSVGLTACGDDSESDDEVTIAGKWVYGHKILELGKSGSYHEYDDNGDQYSHREGSYSYNADQSLMIVNIPASSKNGNQAYSQTYIVYTLTKTTLVLLYTDGDTKGYYTRK